MHLPPFHSIPPPAAPPSQSLSPLTPVSPHVPLEVKGVMKAPATAVAHVVVGRAVALEVPGQHALQREALGQRGQPSIPGPLGVAVSVPWEGCGRDMGVRTPPHPSTGPNGAPRTGNQGGLGRLETAVCVCLCCPLPKAFAHHPAPIALTFYFSIVHTIFQHNIFSPNFIIYTCSSHQIISFRKE